MSVVAVGRPAVTLTLTPTLRGGDALEDDFVTSDALHAGSEGEDEGVVARMAMKATPRKDGAGDQDGFNRRMRQDMRDLLKEVRVGCACVHVRRSCFEENP